MKKTKLLIIGLILLSSIQIFAKDSKKESKFLESYEINYLKSYIVLNKIYAPDFKIGKIFFDYLSFDDQKDILHYALKVEDVYYTYQVGNKTKNKKPQKTPPDINLPIRNVFNEVLLKNINITIKSEKFEVPIHFDDIELTNFSPLDRKSVLNKKHNYFEGKGKALGGKITINGNLNPIFQPLILDFDFKWENISLEKFNIFLDKKSFFKPEDGKGSLYIELATKKNIVDGYIRFKTKNLKVDKKWREDESFLTAIKKKLLGFGIEILDKGKQDKIDGNLPFRGDLEAVNYNYLELISTLLGHILGNPYDANLDESINLEKLDE